MLNKDLQLPEFEPPLLEPNLADDSGTVDRKLFRQLVKRLEPLATGEAPLSNESKRRMAFLRARINEGEILESLKLSRRDIRLIIRLIRDDDEVASSISLSKRRLSQFDKTMDGLTQSLARSWIRAYLERFDQIDGYEALAEYLRHRIQYVQAKRLSPDLVQYQKHRELLFTPRGPSRVARTAIEGETPLSTLVDELSIPKAGNARFFEATTQIYYVETLKRIEFGSHHRVMDEIRKPDVADTSGPDDLLIGQIASQILIERCLNEKQSIPDTWRDFILAICGDPRVPRRSPKFTKWWAQLEAKHVDAMRRWLSKLDLKLFLKVLEEVARTSSDTDMKRMFPARRQFLEGLFNANLVHHSRLILSAEAQSQLRRTFEKEDLPEYAHLSDRNTCLIYLDLGSAHLVEGSHQFAARIYRDMEIRGLSDYSKSYFAISDFPRGRADAFVVHSKSKKPRWQHNLIEKLREPRFGIDINPQDVLTPSDYKIYRREFGMR